MISEKCVSQLGGKCVNSEFFNLIGNDVCSFVIKNYFCIRDLLKLDCLDSWLFLVLGLWHFT